MQISDKFHVVKHLNEAVNQVRREEGIQLKGLMWAMRKREKNQNRKDQKTLEQLKEDNNLLFELYLLKEQFFEFFDYKASEEKEAGEFMHEWISKVALYGLEPMNDFIRYLERHNYSIINIIKKNFEPVNKIV